MTCMGKSLGYVRHWAFSPLGSFAHPIRYRFIKEEFRSLEGHLKCLF